jgi:hypothetical protein
MKLITGKIASIINGKTIIINRGKIHGVKDGMKFAIKLVFPDIIDPDDPNNIVSGLYYTKGTVEVSQVYEKMSSCTLLPQRTKFTDNKIITLQMVFEKENYPSVESQLITDDQWKIRNSDEVVQIEEKEENPV